MIGVTTSGLEGTAINFAIPINYIRGALESSDNSSKRDVGYDIKKVTFNYETPSYTNRTPPSRTPPSRTPPSRTYYPPQPKVEKEKISDSFFTFSISSYKGLKSIYKNNIENKKEPSGESLSLGYHIDDINNFLKFDIIYVGKSFDSRKSLYRAFAAEYGRRIIGNFSLSGGYAISTPKTFGGGSIYKKLQHSKAKQTGMIALNYKLPFMMIKFEYLHDFNDIYLDYLKEKYRPHRGLNINLSIPFGRYIVN